MGRALDRCEEHGDIFRAWTECRFFSLGVQELMGIECGWMQRAVDYSGGYRDEGESMMCGSSSQRGAPQQEPREMELNGIYEEM